MISDIEEAPSVFFGAYKRYLHKNGLILEFGVATGDTIKALALYDKSRIVHGFDSFQGIPESWSFHEKGAFACDIPTDLPENVELHVGWFEDTLPKFIQDHAGETAALIHIDSDLYSSAKTIFKHCGPMIRPGTLLIFDEIMGYEGWEEGEFKAFNEFLEAAGLKAQCVGRHYGDLRDIAGMGDFQEHKAAFIVCDEAGTERVQLTTTCVDLMETNETNVNSNGGTELFMRFLYSGGIPRELLEHVQIIPTRIRELKEDKIRILTVHDMPSDPECVKLKDPDFRKRFHKIVFISNWQYQRFQVELGIPYTEQCVVIENGIHPISVDIPAKVARAKDRLDLAYFSTPHRGLNILFPVFAAHAERDPTLHLHVHSSFEMYGWGVRDEPFKQLFDQIRAHPQCTYYGYTPYDEMRERLLNYHIHTYPCVWPETACRSMIEAMSAGMISVHPNFGGLIDTSGGMNFMYDGSADLNRHAELFSFRLYIAERALKYWPKPTAEKLQFVKEYADRRYSPSQAHFRWSAMLLELIKQYPSLNSRKIPQNQTMFLDTATGRIS
jgi:hypothetical protein